MTNLVFIHGAWASGWAWEPLLPYIHSPDTHCHVINLPDSESYEASLQSQAGIEEYKSHVLNALAKIKGSVWLIAHSGGGLIATAVAEEIPNKIAGIIYVAGMMLPSDMSFSELCQTVAQKGINTQGISPYLQNTQYGTKVKEGGIREVFLHDASEEAIQLAKENLVVQPNASRIISVHWTEERVGRIPKYYIVAERDRSLVLAVQQEMIKLVTPTAAATLDCGHFPQIVIPEQLADVIMEFISNQ
ncbi:alpha/beta hydrolase [Marinomonas sp. GJ51-6]|uniref:alpha/beta fold hydrolase n=1 Tax=Marinomonas sp. GJ51-6 TaxID=2992802 RepID=UPI002934DD76|nr:alpha/beta hydrolase [Marinomonas sp. GJ51-6]WOD08557.1 alpha/beta hydrolase [Marinomonas sp. GJ51-6]